MKFLPPKQYILMLLVGFITSFIANYSTKRQHSAIVSEEIVKIVGDMSSNCWADYKNEAVVNKQLIDFCTNENCEDYFLYLCSFGELQEVTRLAVMQEMFKASVVFDAEFKHGNASFFVQTSIDPETNIVKPIAIILIKDISKGLSLLKQNSANDLIIDDELL